MRIDTLHGETSIIGISYFEDIVIIGDAIIKHISPTKLSKENCINLHILGKQQQI